VILKRASARERERKRRASVSKKEEARERESSFHGSLNQPFHGYSMKGRKEGKKDRRGREGRGKASYLLERG
jgi:hypothetical protein